MCRHPVMATALFDDEPGKRRYLTGEVLEKGQRLRPQRHIMTEKYLGDRIAPLGRKSPIRVTTLLATLVQLRERALCAMTIWQ